MALFEKSLDTPAIHRTAHIREIKKDGMLALPVSLCSLPLAVLNERVLEVIFFAQHHHQEHHQDHHQDGYGAAAHHQHTTLNHQAGF